MAMVAYLGQDVKGYRENLKEKIEGLELRCEKHPSEQRAFHSTYPRNIKESGEEVTIHVMICHECKKLSPTGKGCTIAVLPDFLSPNKHYSANEMETVLLQSDEGIDIRDIDTAASEYTVCRWLKELINKKIPAWLSSLKIIAIERKCPVSEITLAGLKPSDALRALLNALPRINCCGNILGAVRIWVQTRSHLNIM